MTLIPASLRSTVVQRAGSRCEYCRLDQESQVATFPVDHINPASEGGRTELANLALACPRCNAEKWTFLNAQDSESNRIVPLFNPRTQSWDEHFQWSAADSVILEGRTEFGRATIARLALNSERHVTIRRLLLLLDRHPPR